MVFESKFLITVENTRINFQFPEFSFEMKYKVFKRGKDSEETTSLSTASRWHFVIYQMPCPWQLPIDPAAVVVLTEASVFKASVMPPAFLWCLMCDFGEAT